MPPQNPLQLALLVAIATSCIATKVHTSSPPPAPAITAAADSAWEVTSTEGKLLGFLVRFEENRPQEDVARAFFSVRNVYLQELGMVDDLGRSWRFEPHSKEPAWLGSGSIAEGTGQIFDTQIELSRTSLDALAAHQ